MKKFLALTAAALLGAASFTFAQEAQTTTDKPGEGGVSAPESESKLSIEAAANFTNAYFFRGFNIADDGLLFQPEARVGYKAYESDALTITPFVSAWANITDQNYEDGRMDKFDELDLTAGVEFEVERLTLGVEYLYYTSPADNFQDVHELGFSLAFDDSGLTPLPFALNPYIAFYQEIDNPDKIDEDSYLEFGVEPEFEVKDLPVTLTVPVTVGTSLNETYMNNDGDNQFLGYASVGLTATYQINDNWNIHAGVEYIRLVADTTQDANGGDNDAIVGTVGVGFSY